MPLISLIMPMRNARPFVGAALRPALGQERVDLDVIVVDDGSSDGSADVVRSLGDRRVRIIQGPQKGIAAAMNVGLDAATGDLVCRCDADDLYVPGRLARQAAWLADHPDFGAVCGSFTTVSAKGDHLAEIECGLAAEELTSELIAGKTRTRLCTYLMRTAVVRRAGSFRPWFVTAEVADLQLRIGGAARVWYDPGSCYQYRLHGESITRRQSNLQRQFYEDSAVLFNRQRVETGTDDLQCGCPPTPPAVHVDATTHDVGSHVRAILLGESWKLHREGNRVGALHAGLRDCWARPSTLSAWKSLAALTTRMRSGA